MLATARNFNPIVEVFDPYSVPFTNQLEVKSNSNDQQPNYESNSAAMPCTACSACGGCACACSACG
jgi:hypothetical protein